MPVDSFVKAEAAGQGFAAANAAQATLIQGSWLHTEEQQAMLQHQQLQQHQQGLLQSSYAAAADSGGLMAHQHQEAAAMAAAAVQHPTELAGHPADVLGTASTLQHMHGTSVDVALMEANPDMIVEAAAGDLMGHLHAEQLHQDVIMQQACMTAHTGNASNGQLMMQQQQQQDQGAWVAQPAQSNSVSSSVGADSNPREQQQQGQSGLRNSGTHTGSNAGNRKGARKPHLQGRFSGRLATKDDEKKLNQECRLLGPLLGGVGKRGDGSRLTLAKIVRGIAAGEVRKFCEERERIIKVLKQRVSQLESTAQQADVMRQENVMLRQKLMDMESLVRDGRNNIAQQGSRDIHMAAAAAPGQLVDTPMPQAVLDMAAGPVAAVAGVPLMMDAPQTGGSMLNLPPNGNHPGALGAGSMQCGSGSGQGQQALAVAGGPAGLRSLDSFTSTAATDAPNAAMGHLAMNAVPPPAAALAAPPIAVGVHPTAASAGVQGMGGAAAAMQTLSAGRDGSLDGSGVAPLLPPGAPSAAIPIPARVRAAVADPVGMAGSLGTSPGMGPSPGLGPSPGMSTLSGTMEEHGVIPQPSSATAAAAAAAAGVPHVPSVSLGIPVNMITGSQPLAVSQGMGAMSAANVVPAVAADPVTATTAVAAQVAQAAHAVQQQAASLHAAAEVHAQKAHAATSQVQSLQATAQVIAKTHEELVKKIEDVKQTAVAQIQQPVPTVPPEEVVKHAQIEVQKLEAQAQAQAIAAVQVSAAAQRAEAEAQKHLVVHAQVAAQAQQLQAKAVHLQVHADQLSNSAVAAEVAVATAAANASHDLARVGSSTSGPVAVASVGLGAPTVGLPAASSHGAPLMNSAGVTSLAAQGGQQLGELPSSMAMTGLPSGSVMPGVPSLAPPALATQAPPPTAAPVLMGSAAHPQQQQLVAAGVPVEGLPPAGVMAQGLVQTSPTLLPSTVVTTQLSAGGHMGPGHAAVGATGGTPGMPVVSQGLQPASALAPVSSHIAMGQAPTGHGVEPVAAGMSMHMTPAAAPAASTLSGMQQQQQQPPMQQHPTASISSAGALPSGSALVHTSSVQSQQQHAAIEAAVAAQQAAQQAAKMEAANAAAAAAAMQQQAAQAQMEQAAAAAAAAQHAANMHAQQAAQLQADHAAASAAAAAAAQASAQQQMVAYNAAVQADAAAAAVGMHAPVMQDMMPTQHLQQQTLTQPAGVISVHSQSQQQAVAAPAGAGRPPLPPGAMPRDGSFVMSNAVVAPQGSTGSGGVAYATAAEAQQQQQQQLAMMQRMGSGSSQHGMEPSITGGVGTGMPRVESINSIQAMMNSQQQQQQAIIQQQTALQQQQQAASLDLMQQQATAMQQDLMQQQAAAVQQDMMQQQALQQQHQQAAQQQAMQQQMMHQQVMQAMPPQQVSMQPDVMQHDHMAGTMLPQQQQQPLAAGGSGSVMLSSDIGGVVGNTSHMVGGAAAMLPSPPNPQQQQQDMHALQQQQQQQLMQQPSPFQQHAPSSINSPALQDPGVGVAAAAGGNGSSLGNHPSGSTPAPGSYLVSSPQVDSLLTSPAGGALVTPSTAGGLGEKHDPIAQQLQSRGGVDASALDLEVLPQLDPASIEHMIDAPTPGGTINIMSVINDAPGALSQGLEGL